MMCIIDFDLLQSDLLPLHYFNTETNKSSKMMGLKFTRERNPISNWKQREAFRV